MSTHPLARFIYETFGEQFGSLVLAGYGAEPGDAQRSLRLIESEEGEKMDWVIEMVASRHPCGDDPLVLATLLKPPAPDELEAEVERLLSA